MNHPCVVLVERNGRARGVQPQLVPILGRSELGSDLELLVRHAASAWRDEVASETWFSYGGILRVRVFSVADPRLLGVGLYRESAS